MALQINLLTAQIPSTATTVSLDATGSGVGLVQVGKKFYETGASVVI